jgi:hypothetical protein
MNRTSRPSFSGLFGEKRWNRWDRRRDTIRVCHFQGSLRPNLMPFPHGDLSRLAVANLADEDAVRVHAEERLQARVHRHAVAGVDGILNTRRTLPSKGPNSSNSAACQNPRARARKAFFDRRDGQPLSLWSRLGYTSSELGIDAFRASFRLPPPLGRVLVPPVSQPCLARSINPCTGP